jgi:quercetin dioxygenase-like cupin family protein
MRGHGLLNRQAIVAAVLAGIALQEIAFAQYEHTTPAGALQQFACENDGLLGGTPFGCQLLVRSTVAAFPDGPLFWHLRSFDTLAEAEAARAPQDAIAAAGGQAWLFSFGPESLARAGRLVGRVGPLPISRREPFQIQLWYVVMPPGTSTGLHLHPGPEAWYVLEGEQCLDTPNGPIRARAGQGAVVAENIPMRLFNTGTGTRRALFIVIHDPSVSEASASQWTPSGACSR